VRESDWWQKVIRENHMVSGLACAGDKAVRSKKATLIWWITMDLLCTLDIFTLSCHVPFFSISWSVISLLRN